MDVDKNIRFGIYMLQVNASWRASDTKLYWI